ncbi:MAG: DUF4411 family protein [Bifidobacteriaceae bacterium]|jgi:hypothetical protein|nr:DUF4411 family protein [Bifidobacteriaceae bacterium]
MYLLDSNVFIEAHRRYYGIDFVPGFWDWLHMSNGSGLLASIDKIRQELEDGTYGDELKTWVRGHKDLFLPIDSVVQGSFQKLSAWTMDQSHGYTSAAKRTFMGSGDYQLVAYAHAHGHTVATHEQARPDAKKVIKIPDACRALGVECVDPFKMLRDEQARFVLNGAP